MAFKGISNVFKVYQSILHRWMHCFRCYQFLIHFARGLRGRGTSAEHANAISIDISSNSSNSLLSISWSKIDLNKYIIPVSCHAVVRTPCTVSSYKINSQIIFSFVFIEISADRLTVGGEVSTKVKRLRSAIIVVCRCWLLKLILTEWLRAVHIGTQETY